MARKTEAVKIFTSSFQKLRVVNIFLFKEIIFCYSRGALRIEFIWKKGLWRKDVKVFTVTGWDQITRQTRTVKIFTHSFQNLRVVIIFLFKEVIFKSPSFSKTQVIEYFPIYFIPFSAAREQP